MRSRGFTEIVSVLAGCFAATCASAATVTFDIAPVNGSPGDEVSVTPGEEVAYEITARVVSDDAQVTDHDGLAFFSLNIQTDLGATQAAADAFDPIVGAAFTILQSLGRANDDDVLEIGGGQNTFTSGTATTGIAAEASQVLVRGRLLTPGTEGTFTITLTGSANVFDPGSDTSVSKADVLIGPALILRTAIDSPADDPDDAATGGDDSADDASSADDQSDATTGPDETVDSMQTAMIFGAVAAVVLGALLLAGPLAGGGAVVLAIVIALLLVLAS